MKILILGAKGMLGQELVKIFANLKPVSWDRPDLDIADKKAVFLKLSALKPDLVINAAAYTAVDDCEKNQALARRVNGLAPGYLAQACCQISASLIHYSTDYVFAGRKKTGYFEKDKPVGPLNVYGQSKLQGEKLVQKYLDRFYLIRSSWLFGPGGKNFVATMLNLAKDHSVLKVVNDQFGKPTYTLDLAKRTRQLIETGPSFGIYHLTNETQPGGISWHQFSREIFKQACELGLTKDLPQVKPCSSQEFLRPARRPHFSVLNNIRLPKSRAWQKALFDYLTLLTKKI